MRMNIMMIMMNMMNDNENDYEKHMIHKNITFIIVT